ncbi:MAG: MBL fold metallo-hydrolase [Actinomycetota bacterium]|nr:MBL fold metallo-hydrolase [Actinomycetota bacterium]
MTDRPRAGTAYAQVLHVGYGSNGVASTTGFIRDADLLVVTDPGMVSDRRVILEPLREVGVEPGEVTDVIFSHHHPDHTLNAALFPNARFHDHWAIYKGDQWQWRDAEGFELSPAVRLIRTPGHTAEDITVLAGTPDGVYAYTHVWNDAQSAGDRHAEDMSALHLSRLRVLAAADVVVPGHGALFVPDESTPR